MKKIKKHYKKFITLFIFVTILFSMPIKSSLSIKQNSISYNSGLIDEFTWAFMKYDCNWDSKNHNISKMPKPDPGTILVISNMISLETCSIALEIAKDSKMETLRSLEDYDFENFRIPFYADKPILTTLLGNFAAITDLIPVFGIQKFTINEMLLFQTLLNKGNIIGDCYSQAVLNTAILRLCGFSPEEVFTILIPIHALNIVKCNDQWYIFDSVSAQESGKAIYESYQLPDFMQKINAIENDKYFINFGRGKSDIKPYLENLFSNMEPNILIDIIEDIKIILSNASLGDQELNINDFIENAYPCPEIKTIGIPYNIYDSKGDTNQEKTYSLASMNKEFVFNQTNFETPNQYDRGLYCYGLLSLEYPQAYANAAKYCTWSSYYASIIDSINPEKDIYKTGKLLNYLITDSNLINDYVLTSDFIFQIKEASTIDKSITAYGILRNMIKENDFWCTDNLYILITNDYQGYLAINVNDDWQYLSFDGYSLLSESTPEGIIMVFNEVDYSNSWEK